MKSLNSENLASSKRSNSSIRLDGIKFFIRLDVKIVDLAGSLDDEEFEQ